MIKFIEWGYVSRIFLSSHLSVFTGVRFSLRVLSYYLQAAMFNVTFALAVEFQNVLLIIS